MVYADKVVLFIFIFIISGMEENQSINYNKLKIYILCEPMNYVDQRLTLLCDNIIETWY